MAHVPWSRVQGIHEGLLANVGECLIHTQYATFRAAGAAWSAHEPQFPEAVRRYGGQVLAEVGDQWEHHRSRSFDVNRLDQVVAAAVRGLQPAEVRAALGALPPGDSILRCFLEETLHLLVETIDLTRSP